VAIYNRALSASEVAGLYQMALAGPTKPTISQQPVSQTMYAGQPATFNVIAVGGAPYTYQWQHNGADIPGATGSTLTLTSASATDAGTYTVKVTNDAGSVDSAAATITVLPVTSGSYTEAVFAKNPVAYWPFNETEGSVVFDNIGGRQGRVSPLGATLGATGPLPPDFLGFSSNNTAVATDGAAAPDSGQVLVPYDPTLNTPQFSVSFWVMPGGTGTGTPLANVHYSSPRSGWWIRQNSGGWRLYLYNQNGTTAALDITGGGAPVVGAWSHVAMVYDGVKGHVYVNGVEAASGTAAGFVPNTDAPLTLGTRSENGTPWPGSLDEVLLFDRALSADEIQALYHTAVTGQAAVEPVTLTIGWSGANLQLNWTSGTLQSADEITGPWAPVTGASAPTYQVTPTASKKFYRVQM